MLPDQLVDEADDPPRTAAGAVFESTAWHRPGEVRLRSVSGGALAYVPQRDRFVALGVDAGLVLKTVEAGQPMGADMLAIARELAAAGVLEAPVGTPVGRPRPGRSLIGDCPDLPTITEPLVVNTFATAMCPLRCRYCHADDLMQPFRADETDDDVEQVAATAGAVPAMVAVITGGDPIMRPDRTIALIDRLAPRKAIVVDTSGAGDLSPLVPVLKSVQGHLRVSLDSADAAVNDRLRPINPRMLPRGTSSHTLAWDSIRRAGEADVPTTVQTVVSRVNEDVTALTELAHRLCDSGVRQWVLHVAVPAGRAAGAPGRNLLPGAGVAAMLGELIRRLDGDPAFRTLRVRVTATHTSPNAVLLVGSRGDVYLEKGPAGKTRLCGPGTEPAEILRLFRENIDLPAHAARYLGGTDPFGPIGSQAQHT